MAVFDDLIVRLSPTISNDFTDSCGSYDGTASGATVVTEDTQKAFLYDGTDDYVSLGYPLVDGLTAMTVCAWVKLDVTTQFHMLLGGIDSGAANGVQFYITTTNARIALILRDASDNDVAVDDTSALSVDTWHHVAFTWDGTTAKRYLDGVATGTNLTTSISKIGDSGVHTHVGAQLQGVTRSLYLDGHVSDFMVFGEAKSAADIAAIEAETRGFLAYPSTVQATSVVSTWSTGSVHQLVQANDGKYARANVSDDGESIVYTFNTDLAPATVETATVNIAHKRNGAGGAARVRIQTDGSTWSAWETLTDSGTVIEETFGFTVDAALTNLKVEVEAPPIIAFGEYFDLHKLTVTLSQPAAGGLSIPIAMYHYQQQQRR